jgi:hypothetical protein
MWSCPGTGTPAPSRWLRSRHPPCCLLLCGGGAHASGREEQRERAAPRSEDATECTTGCDYSDLERVCETGSLAKVPSLYRGSLSPLSGTCASISDDTSESPKTRTNRPGKAWITEK